MRPCRSRINQLHNQRLSIAFQLKKFSREVAPGKHEEDFRFNSILRESFVLLRGEIVFLKAIDQVRPRLCGDWLPTTRL